MFNHSPYNILRRKGSNLGRTLTPPALVHVLEVVKYHTAGEVGLSHHPQCLCCPTHSHPPLYTTAAHTCTHTQVKLSKESSLPALLVSVLST